ncbi:SLOG family protein [[Clostridium] colinum]|uniref:SLOG family protein n=1 Tax=[Clostridium] colinum TaxID=36835 RepID=UPI0020250939|nr:SLOG family protein [[Clostridium] colinum]
MNKVCSFTGHRPNKFNFKYDEEHIDCIRIKAKLIDEIENLYLNGVKYFLTGCAMGVDIWCAEIVLQLMKKYNDIKLFCVLPFNNHCEKWNESYKLRLKNIIDNSTKTIKLQESYTTDCYFKRNKYLVDKSNIILGVYDLNIEKSGTKNTLNYAIQQNKEIIILSYFVNLQIYKYFKL